MIVRESRLGDETSVIELWVRNGLTPNPSANDWNWLWLENPAYQQGWPLGWVLEKDGKILGYLGNVPLRYFIKGKSITVACARGYAADPEARSHSLKLASSFFSQKQADLLIMTTTNEASAVVYKMCRAVPLPINSYNNSLTWVIKGRDATRSLFLKYLALPRSLATGLAMIIAPALSVWLHIRMHGSKRVPKRWGGQVVSIPASEIDCRFDQLWERRKMELPNTLLGDRSAETLRWHYGHTAVAYKKTNFLTAIQHGQLRGYLILTRDDSPEIALKRYRISDLFVSMDDEDVIDALLKKAFHIAKEEKVHLIDTVGFPDSVRGRLLATRPLRRVTPVSRFWYYTKDTNLGTHLARPDAWHPTPFDGDSSL